MLNQGHGIKKSDMEDALDWKLLGTATGYSNAVSLSGKKINELYLTVIIGDLTLSASIPYIDLSSTAKYYSLTARIYSSSANDFGARVSASTSSINVVEATDNRTITTDVTLKVYYR